jgi:hypothetical protein
MRSHRLTLVLAFVCLFGSVAANVLAAEPTAVAERPYDPIERYAERDVEGWRVLLHKQLLEREHQELAERTLKVLGEHLFRVMRVLPAEPLARVRKVPIWVERAHPRHPCMCYHASADWLKQHGMNPQKAGAVEIANCRNFLDWTVRDQPWMVLHELAHAYHHQVLGNDHAEIKACYEEAVASNSYESVLHISGKKRRHYALTNSQEYFAEATDAYFGTNDFYPFVRAELRQHDPRAFAMIEKLWRVRPGSGAKR